MKPLTATMLVAVAAMFAGCDPAPSSRYSGGSSSPSRSTETYRLVHAIGNTENVSARNLSKPECERRKADLKATATALGTYNEATGYGSITCLPESYFE